MSKRIGPEMFGDVLDKTQADIENEVLSKVPAGAEIPIITGGTTVGEAKGFGPSILVEITDTLDPEGNALFPISVSTRRGEFTRKLPLNKPVMVPEKVVQYIEGLRQVNTRRIGEESAMYADKGLAEFQNPGMRYRVTENGVFLTRTSRRYMVRRVPPQEMRTR